MATCAVVWLLEPAAAASVRREVTFAVRVEGDPARNVRLRVALPEESETRRVNDAMTGSAGSDLPVPV